MSEINEHVQIWKAVKDSQKLFDIYQSFPTLHDAAIENIDVDFEKKEFSLTVAYSDFIIEPGDSVLTKITILWRDVQKADFNWYAEDLLGMKFSMDGEFIKTKFTNYAFGFDGEILAREIEIKDVVIEPERDKISEGNTIKFSLQ
jgi:hypothetical protein